MQLIWVGPQAVNFFSKDWTTQISLILPRKLVFTRTLIVPRTRAPRAAFAAWCAAEPGPMPRRVWVPALRSSVEGRCFASGTRGFSWSWTEQKNLARRGSVSCLSPEAVRCPPSPRIGYRRLKTHRRCAIAHRRSQRSLVIAQPNALAASVAFFKSTTLLIRFICEKIGFWLLPIWQRRAMVI
jgi:hypothetical protein